MGKSDPLKSINSGDSHERALAALNLKDSFEEAAGDLLIKMLLTESEEGPFRLACDAVIPKWIVKLERRLSAYHEWPFDPLRTAWLVYGVRGWRLPSLENRVLEFLRSNDWVLRLAAANYCDDKLCFTKEARQACTELLAEGISSGADMALLLRAMGVRTPEALANHVRSLIADFTPEEPEAR